MAYVAMTPDPTFDDYVFLGDLHWYFGQDEDAKAAYKEALARQPAGKAPLLTQIIPGASL